MTTALKYVVALVDDEIAIGPFDNLPEAHAYRDTDTDKERMHVLSVQAPEPGWKKKALSNWPHGVNRSNKQTTAGK